MLQNVIIMYSVCISQTFEKSFAFKQLKKFYKIQTMTLFRCFLPVMFVDLSFLTCFLPGWENRLTDDHWRPHEWLHRPDWWHCTLWEWVLTAEVYLNFIFASRDSFNIQLTSFTALKSTRHVPWFSSLKHETARCQFSDFYRKLYPKCFDSIPNLFAYFEVDVQLCGQQGSAFSN